MELLKGQALVLVVAGLAVSAALMETAAAADTNAGAAPTGLAKRSSERGDAAANGAAVANQAPPPEMAAEELKHRLSVSEQLTNNTKQSLAKVVKDLNAEIENAKKTTTGLITASVIAGLLAAGGIGLELWRRKKEREHDWQQV